MTASPAEARLPSGSGTSACPVGSASPGRDESRWARARALSSATSSRVGASRMLCRPVAQSAAQAAKAWSAAGGRVARRGCGRGRVEAEGGWRRPSRTARVAAASAGVGNRRTSVRVDGARVVEQVAQHPAGGDRGELPVVADQADAAAAAHHVPHHVGELAGRGHAGLVDDHQRARPDRAHPRRRRGRRGGATTRAWPGSRWARRGPRRAAGRPPRTGPGRGRCRRSGARRRRAQPARSSCPFPPARARAGAGRPRWPGSAPGCAARCPAATPSAVAAAMAADDPDVRRAPAATASGHRQQLLLGPHDRGRGVGLAAVLPVHALPVGTPQRRGGACPVPTAGPGHRW